jgi:hypothetical protein
MSMPPSSNKLEGATKGLAKAHRIVPHYRKAAASFRSIERKGRDDCMPSDLQGSLKAHDISSTVTVLGEEVEGRPIMPNVVNLHRLPDCSIRYNPMNL